MGKVNGLQEKQNTVGIMYRDWNKDMDNCTFLLVIFIKEILFKISVKAMEKCFGLIAVFIRDNGEMEFKMEKDRST